MNSRWRTFPAIASFVGLCALASICHANPALASSQVTASLPAVQIDQFGPAIWGISKGNHVLWIVGSVAPIQKDLQWSHKNVAELMKTAQVFVAEPVGGFKKWVPTLRLIQVDWLEHHQWRKNPHGAVLSNILPNSIYEQWLQLWKKYGHDRNPPDRLTPFYAQKMLYKHFRNRYELRERYVDHALEHIARHDGLRIKHPIVAQHVSHFEKTFLRAHKLLDGDYFACFRATIARVAHDYPKIYYRAKAWAIGDISRIEYLKPTSRRSCHWNHEYGTIYADRYGAQNPHFAHRIIIYYQKILQKYPVAVTVLPISDLLSAKGFVYQFRKLGYAITDPQGIPAPHEEHQKLSATASRQAHA